MFFSFLSFAFIGKQINVHGIHLSWTMPVIGSLFKRYSVAEGPVEKGKALGWLKEPWGHLKQHLTEGNTFSGADIPGGKPYNVIAKGNRSVDEIIWMPWIVSENRDRYAYMLSEEVWLTVCER